MTAVDPRLRRYFVALPASALALTVVVVVASAFMRHAQAGLGCVDWPACYARLAADASAAAPSLGVHVARIAHRFAATGVLALVVGAALIAWTQRPAWKRDGALALAALVVALALAALGILTPRARLPAVTLGNLLGGYLLVAVLAAAVATATGAPSASRAGTAQAARLRRSALGTLALVFVQAVLGGMIGAQFALTACPTLGSCTGIAFEGLLSAEAFDAFRPLVVGGGRVVPPDGAAAPFVVHRLLGAIVAVAVLALAYASRRARPRAATILAALALAAPLAGIAAVAALPSLPLTVAHNALAAALVGALAWLAAGRAPPPDAE